MSFESTKLNPTELMHETRPLNCDSVHIESALNKGDHVSIHVTKMSSTGLGAKPIRVGNTDIKIPIPTGHEIGPISIDYKWSSENGTSLPFLRVLFEKM